MRIIGPNPPAIHGLRTSFDGKEGRDRSLLAAYALNLIEPAAGKLSPDMLSKERNLEEGSFRRITDDGMGQLLASASEEARVIGTGSAHPAPVPQDMTKREGTSTTPGRLGAC
ncbi:MAG: hypothetical protein AAGG44_12930 [Planctomycetota bacterium]